MSMESSIDALTAALIGHTAAIHENTAALLELIEQRRETVAAAGDISAALIAAAGKPAGAAGIIPADFHKPMEKDQAAASKSAAHIDPAAVVTQAADLSVLSKIERGAAENPQAAAVNTSAAESKPEKPAENVLENIEKSDGKSADYEELTPENRRGIFSVLNPAAPDYLGPAAAEGGEDAASPEPETAAPSGRTAGRESDEAREAQPEAAGGRESGPRSGLNKVAAEKAPAEKPSEMDVQAAYRARQSVCNLLASTLRDNKKVRQIIKEFCGLPASEIPYEKTDEFVAYVKDQIKEATGYAY
jgi:hypothetical protein